MKKITKTWLKRQGACRDQLKLFTELYPEGIEVCWKCAQEAQRKGLDISWLMWVVSHSAYRELVDFYTDAPVKSFPKLAKRFGVPFNAWDINILPGKALRILEKAFLENDFDPFSIV
jgi:hypothetical protein